MALDFGLIGDKPGVQSSDYKSAGSHQVENLHYKLMEASGSYSEITTVTVGKTYYATLILIATASASITVTLATGAGGSEADFLNVVITADVPFILPMPTPIKFSSGTRISAKTSTANKVHFMLAGWQE